MNRRVASGPLRKPYSNASSVTSRRRPRGWYILSFTKTSARPDLSPCSPHGPGHVIVRGHVTCHRGCSRIPFQDLCLDCLELVHRPAGAEPGVLMGGQGQGDSSPDPFALAPVTIATLPSDWCLFIRVQAPSEYREKPEQVRPSLCRCGEEHSLLGPQRRSGHCCSPDRRLSFSPQSISGELASRIWLHPVGRAERPVRRGMVIDASDVLDDDHGTPPIMAGLLNRSPPPSLTRCSRRRSGRRGRGPVPRASH